MKFSESSIRRFLEIQSHERFAKLYLKHTKTPLIVLSKKEIFMYNPEFKYYQLVEQGGSLVHLFLTSFTRRLKLFTAILQINMLMPMLIKSLKKIIKMRC